MIKKFIVVNNYGTIQCGNNISEITMTASKSINGATGVTGADFINGRRVLLTTNEETNTTADLNTTEAISQSTVQDTSTMNL
ncbi:hypothetical protein P6P90_05920 [Ectobacillus antri]|jgi:hypothetical protein|uniref:Spore germination protein n=1 Tax=Ectobacillus antri TaxID=2486280 RepID=A0ABT6H2H1_9BACI|nr:hypothetical protein [Ectobacillus antri]MDG4656462.1 hypothetical protein [Ectobacillus antri]MDG5753512.1 hypothetical protein [Ectobacillus antri]